jgi:hypothetical protein
MSTLKKAYTLDRKAASRLLKISIRTLDRYVKANRVSTRLVDGRVWLDKNELASFRKTRERPIEVDKIDMSTQGLSIDNEVDNVDRIEIITDNIDDSVSTSRPRKKKENFYENMYFELKDELHYKQERLEIANYRVGQLEAQVKNSIPLLEYHQKAYEIEKKEEELKEKLNLSNSLVKRVSSQLKIERLGKKAFLTVLLIILALQPLWLLLLKN